MRSAFRVGQLRGLLLWLVVTYAAATVGAMASINAASFYATLAKPAWAPPSGVFGPVWTMLYLLMGIAAWLVWRERGFAAAKPALLLYLAQLAVNALWSWLFFAWHLGGAAFTDILLLLPLIVATLHAFGRRQPIAALLLTPYLCWVTFAAVLNFTVWRLNPALL